jgi:hypothetical protein
LGAKTWSADYLQSWPPTWSDTPHLWSKTKRGSLTAFERDRMSTCILLRPWQGGFGRTIWCNHIRTWRCRRMTPENDPSKSKGRDGWPGRSVMHALARLSALVLDESTPTSEPTGLAVANLSGFGRAKSWALELAEDIRDWTAATIEWRDVDCGLLLSGPPGKTMFAEAVARRHSTMQHEDPPVFSFSMNSMRLATGPHLRVTTQAMVSRS